MTTQDFNAYRPPLGDFGDGSPWPIGSDTDMEDSDEDDDAPTEPRVTLLGDSIGARMMRAMYAVPALLKLERDTERDELRGIPATWGAHGRRTKVELSSGLLAAGVQVVATYDTRVAGRREYQVIMEEYGIRSAVLRLRVPEAGIFGTQKNGSGILGRVLVDNIDDHDEVRAAVKRLIGAKEST